MKPIRMKEIGVLSVDAGDVVCFSMDSVMRIAAELGRGFCKSNEEKGMTVQEMSDDIDYFIKEHSGIPCDFRADGAYGVSKVTAIGQTGDEYSGILIGGPDGDIRLLNKDEESYDECMERNFGDDYMKHPRHGSPEYKAVYDAHRKALLDG